MAASKVNLGLAHNDVASLEEPRHSAAVGVEKVKGAVRIYGRAHEMILVVGALASEIALVLGAKTSDHGVLPEPRRPAE